MNAVVPINAPETQDAYRAATFMESVFAGQESGIVALFGQTHHGVVLPASGPGELAA